jgi:hypothetical protein
MVGNSYSTEVSNGYCDASVGLYLRGDGHGNFNPLPPQASGFYADQDAKGMALMAGHNGTDHVLIGNNSSIMQAYSVPVKQEIVKLRNNDSYALIKRQSGLTYKQEFYYGSTYLSQSSRRLHIPADAVSVKIVDMQGGSRLIDLQTK